MTNWYDSMYSSQCIDYSMWNKMVSSICHHGPDYISQVMPWGVSSSRISGQLLSLHSSRDINTWDSHNYNNSSLIWDDSLKKFKAMKSGGGTGDLTQATADVRYAGSSNVNQALINSISSNLDTRVDSIFNYSSNVKSLYAGSSQVSGRFYPSALGKSLMNFSANKSLYANSANVRYRFPASSTAISKYRQSSAAGSTRWIYVSSTRISSNIITSAYLNTISSNLDAKIDAITGVGRGGYASVANGGTISHGFGSLPNNVTLAPSGSAAPLVYSFKVDTSNITVYHSSKDSEIFSWRCEGTDPGTDNANGWQSIAFCLTGQAFAHGLGSKPVNFAVCPSGASSLAYTASCDATNIKIIHSSKTAEIFSWRAEI